jgi:Ca2+-binding EF-hand superfamily protein
MGAPQAENEPVGTDAWTLSQAANFSKSDPNTYHGVKSSAITRFIEAARGSQKSGGKKDLKGMFLQFDGQVLRFLCLWDDTKTNLFGEKYKYWLSYFLATQEVEMKEAKGKKQFMGCPTLLKRARLPRTASLAVNDDRMRSCENVTGDEDYFNEDDFVVGREINVFGRTMTLCDCDPFTQQWYLEHKGVDQKAAAIDVAEPVSVRPELPVPPHPGFGREEDTIESWKSLIPKRPKTDMKALHGGTGMVRRFRAKLVTTDPINCERVFVISVYLDDGELAVYESKIRNSGVEGGVFMKKQKLRREDTHEYFKPEDFEVGVTVVMKAHPLAIFEEERQPATPVADVDVIIHKLKKKILDASASLRKMFRKFDTDFSQTISFDEFTRMLDCYSLAITKYEAIVLFKAFEDKPGFMSYEMFMRVFDRAEYTVNGGREKSVGDTSREMAESHSHEELDGMIAEARAHAKAAEYSAAQELLIARVARSMKNARTAQNVHDNFRRFGAYFFLYFACAPWRVPLFFPCLPFPSPPPSLPLCPLCLTSLPSLPLSKSNRHEQGPQNQQGRISQLLQEPFGL